MKNRQGAENDDSIIQMGEEWSFHTPPALVSLRKSAC